MASDARGSWFATRHSLLALGSRPRLLVSRTVSVCEDVRNRSCKDDSGTPNATADNAPTNAVANVSPDPHGQLTRAAPGCA